ncbi:hypothetical protein RHMOL_Rhmol04G0368400 [Rhododendron molle]|nr:hypothetical protein RHMOL_Rhmol04G0368400 [Rhododendron molle]
MKYTTATFATAMSNILPAITFVMAWVLRMEKLKINSICSQAKIMGTVATVAGAMLMTLVKGPVIELFRAKGSSAPELQGAGLTLKHSIKWSLMITVGCFSWAAFMNLQAITLRTYPAELSLTAWLCILGIAQGAVVALVMERGKASVWSINWDAKFLKAVYSVRRITRKTKISFLARMFSMDKKIKQHIRCDGVIYTVMGVMVIVAGQYLVIWGKSNDYKSESPITDEQTTQAKQLTDSGNNGDLIPCHGVITINASNEGTMTVEEQKRDKGNQIKPSN